LNVLSCKEASRLVSESLDRKLPWHQRLAVRFHLLLCRFCSRFRSQLLFLRAAARHHRAAVEEADATAGPALSPEARQRIKRLLQSDAS
jgi:hypothetical protein